MKGVKKYYVEICDFSGMGIVYLESMVFTGWSSHNKTNLLKFQSPMTQILSTIYVWCFFDIYAKEEAGSVF